MKLRLLLLLIASILFLTACEGTVSDAPEINSASEFSIGKDSPENTENLTEETDNSGKSYSNKVYYVGEDIPAGGYVINCTNTNYTMSVLIFASAQDFKGFQDSKKFTLGEFSDAVELYAWANFYLGQDDKAYIGLREGYIILLDGGKCEFNTYNPSEEQTLYSGLYVVGEDVNAEKINILCTTDYLKMTLFSGKDDYLNYHKSSRFTIGEETEAIQEFAESSDFIYTDDSTYANLRDGMIMMIEEGVGKSQVDEGPVIN